MSICVKSEIGRLKQVMVHRPGRELEHLVPGELERLLFDDIPYLKVAREEHDTFAGIMRDQGVQVVYLEDLAAEALRTGPEVRERFIDQFIQEGGSMARQLAGRLKELLGGIEDERELVLKTMAGVGSRELEPGACRPLAELVRPSSRFVLDPIPNLYFTRDPFAAVGTGVSLNYMYSQTRRRETIYGEYILKYHPDFRETPLYYDRGTAFHIEGGDILNLSAGVLAVGLSQRTAPEAIEILAENLFWDERSQIRTILALDIPNIRAFMHLDTVLTQVDRDTFTVHPDILGSLRVFELTPGEKKGQLKARELEKSLGEILAKALGLDRVKLIFCGGKDRVASQREQWNDGSNTLCIEPGKVVVYDRNYVTNELLKSSGIQVLEMPSSELSRGRGGPRCMSMPLIREQP